MIGLLFSPLGRYIVLGGVLIVLAGAAYVKIRSDAIAEIEARATADALERVQGAFRAGESVDLSAERLRDNDGHRRD